MKAGEPTRYSDTSLEVATLPFYPRRVGVEAAAVDRSLYDAPIGQANQGEAMPPSDHEQIPTRSSLDRGELPERIADWFRSAIPGSDPEIGPVTSPGGSGMSSETLLFDAAWTEGGQRRSLPLVIRMAPAGSDVPVFPSYDLESQFKVIRLVGEHTVVPVPETIRYEPDPGHLGQPFFVMGQVSGQVPADIPPYCMDGWLLTTPTEQQTRLQDSSVRLLADLHSLDIADHDVSFLELDTEGDTPLRRHMAEQRRYYAWVRDDRHHPVIDAAFDWLESNWPTDEGPTVISWGDSRIGNVMYDDFSPVAVLDWEMAALAPAEMDLGWMIFMHLFFQDICEVLELPGMPEFLQPERAREVYEAHRGRSVQNLEWFITYAALRHAIIMTRVTARSVHFGEAEWGDDHDACIPHRAVLAKMVDGSWWS